MASAVATPLERRFGRIAGVDRDHLDQLARRDRRSRCSSTSTATSTPPRATCRRPSTPPAASCRRTCRRRPNYRKVNPADAPILILSLTSETLPLAQVFDAANTVLAQKISQVDGVGQVFVGGGQQPAVRVQVDPVALAGVGLPRGRARRARAGHRQPAQGRARRPAQTRTHRAPTTSSSAPPPIATLIIAYQNGAAGAPRRRRHASSTTSRTTASPPGSTASARCC